MVSSFPVIGSVLCRVSRARSTGSTSCTPVEDWRRSLLMGAGAGCLGLCCFGGRCGFPYFLRCMARTPSCLEKVNRGFLRDTCLFGKPRTRGVYPLRFQACPDLLKLLLALLRPGLFGGPAAVQAQEHQRTTVACPGFFGKGTSSDDHVLRLQVET